MHKKVAFIVSVVASLATAGCGNGTQSGNDSGSKISETIKAQDVQWEKDFADKDVNSIEDHFQTDGALAGPGYFADTDAERRRVLAAFMGDPGFRETFASDRVDVATTGDLATSRGHFSITMTDRATSKPVDVAGQYLNVYRKESDGSWKAAARFLTRGPMAEAATAK